MASSELSQSGIIVHPFNCTFLRTSAVGSTSAALVRSAPSKTIASANIRRDAALSFSRPAAARSSIAVKSLRVTAIAAIVLAPHHTKSSSIQTFSDSGTPTSHPFSPLVLYPVSYTHLRAHETVLDL